MQLFINFQAFYRIIYNYAFKDNYDHLNYYDEKIVYSTERPRKRMHSINYFNIEYLILF